jgi:hypothetical protein
MTTRAIVTSQPDVECYVCQRRLLRGEHPEVFLADGEPSTVCELCAPRAAHEGWPREHEGHTPPAQPSRGRRGRGILARLRPASAPAADSVADAEDGVTAGGEQAPYDLAPGAAPEDASAPAPVGDGPFDRAVAAFNASAYPRRVASLARSLGAPEVSVQVDHGLRVASILVAWELCWYRYRIDLDEEQPEVTASAQGTELSELGAEERECNAVADERGGLALIAASV